MKIAIFGDVHSNIEALTAVLEDASRHGVSHYACTGDIVGYNGSPHECVEVIRNLECPVVMGNHDEEAVSTDLILGMNDRARQAMEWTRGKLTEEDRGWLSRLPAVCQVHGFTIVHASLEYPKVWGYVMSRFDAMGSFDYQFTPLCFYGHTHMPVVYVKTRGTIVRECVEGPVHLQPDAKYMINIGSVGMSRDGDPRAAYALYDMERAEITIRRIPYDMEGAAAKTRCGPGGGGGCAGKAA